MHKRDATPMKSIVWPHKLYDPSLNPVPDPSRGGLSSATPRPLSLIGSRPLPRLTLSHGLGSMVLETKIASLKSKAHHL